MEWDKCDKSENKSRDRQYAKPHFGPEETAEVIENAYHAEKRKKNLIRKYLEMQIADKQYSNNLRNTRERRFDNTYLTTTKATQQFEDIVKEQTKQQKQ